MTDTSRMAKFYPMTETGYLAFYTRSASAKNLAEIGREVGYAQSSAGKKSARGRPDSTAPPRPRDGLLLHRRRGESSRPHGLGWRSCPR